jgi:hypothetical protein
MFPPGRARLTASPVPITSPIDAITMGIVLVAFRAASAEGVPLVTMTSTLRRASPAGFCPRHWFLGLLGWAALAQEHSGVKLLNCSR